MIAFLIGLGIAMLIIVGIFLLVYGLDANDLGSFVFGLLFLGLSMVVFLGALDYEQSLQPTYTITCYDNVYENVRVDLEGNTYAFSYEEDNYQFPISACVLKEDELEE